MFSSGDSPGAPAAAAQRTVQRWKAWLTMIIPNSNSDSAGISPAARWAEETIGPSGTAGFIARLLRDGPQRMPVLFAEIK